MSMDERVIALTDLTKQYGRFTAVDRICLTIRKGEIFGLLGPNGAGKSTTILMMLGLTEPTSGSVEICGIDSTRHPIEVKRKIGYLPEDVGFYDDMTGPENLIYTARLNGISDAEAKVKALELMEHVGLAGQMKKKTGKYSRGMRQRLGLADVLIKNPEIIILDEPTSGIDPAGVQEFIELIRQLSRKEGLTVLFSSHHLDQVQKVCDRVGLFNSGKLVTLIDMSDLKDKNYLIFIAIIWRKEEKGMNKVNYPFWVVVNKEISDHVKSWRFIILMGIILLTCMGSLYTSLTNIGAAIKPNDPDGSFLFLKLFTASDGTLPSFVQFINFLGPLLGIALGFDAINSEQNKGTLSRMLSQPVHRDCIINAKFVAALIVIGIMLFVLGFLVMGCGLIAIGIPPTAEEFWRIVFFLIISVFYVAFWLNLAILFSLCFRQAATSALASVAVWLFFSVFYTMIVNLVAKALSPSQLASPYQIVSYQKFILGLMRLAPSELFNEATTTLLMPSVRSLGPLTMEQVQGAIPSPLPLGQSLLVVWPQLTGLIAATVICFALSYVIFMRREVRSR